MNTPALPRPFMDDTEGFADFTGSLKECAPSSEVSVAKLRRTPDDQSAPPELFRVVHNIKGDASLYGVRIGAALLHPIKTLLARLRRKGIRLMELFAEPIPVTADGREFATQTVSEHAHGPSWRC